MRVTMMLEGMPSLLQNTQRLRSVLTRQGATSAWNGAQHLFARTRAVVPYENGDLYNSAYMANISTDKKSVWVVGYDTVAIPYAWDVHEIPNRVHPTRGPSHEPKQDHFLSEPRDTMSQTWSRTVADDFQDALRGAKFARGR